MPRSVKCWPVKSGLSAASAGFTFVELLTVVAIVSILAAIALPAYRQYQLRAEVAEGLVLLGDAKTGVNEFYSRWGRLPADNSEAGLRLPDALRGKYVRSIDVSGGVLVASMELGHDLGDQSIISRTLTLRPWLNTTNPGAPIIWSCAENDPKAPKGYHVVGSVADDAVDPKWLPTVCR